MKKLSLRWLLDLWPDPVPAPPLPRKVRRKKEARRRIQKMSRWKNRR